VKSRSVDDDPGWSVVVCSYTFERLELTSACIWAVLAQPERPEVIVVTDHNDELGEALRTRFPGVKRAPSTTPAPGAVSASLSSRGRLR